MTVATAARAKGAKNGIIIKTARNSDPESRANKKYR
jgi:DNA-directed RNA polymerase subunit H (RpoH/RPB5)